MIQFWASKKLISLERISQQSTTSSLSKYGKGTVDSRLSSPGLSIALKLLTDVRLSFIKPLCSIVGYEYILSTSTNSIASSLFFTTAILCNTALI